jgi:ribosomal protein S18 acetylase RimI-like enzyme
MIVIETHHSASPELLAATNHLIPQLSSSFAGLTMEQLEAVLVHESVTLFVARADSSIVGLLTLTMFPLATGLRAWIEDVVVDTSARGQGVGDALVNAAIATARDAGAHTVDLTSRSDREAAHRLYERMGFVRRETNVYRFSLDN